MPMIDWFRQLANRKAKKPATELERQVHALEHGPDLQARLQAVKALAEMGDPAAFEPLAGMLCWSDFYDNWSIGVALGRLDKKRAAPLLVQALRDHEISPLVAKKSLKPLGAHATMALLKAYREDRYIDMARLLVEMDCVAAVPELKRDLERGQFAGFSTDEIKVFLERHQKETPETETAQCHICSQEKPVTELRGAGDLWFCPGDCWRRSGEILSRGIGKDCPLYDRGFCTTGDGKAYCSLEVGGYATDCHVYAIHGGR